MIRSIHLENFKRFADLTLRTAPLTVLTGTNGAGKTSVIHALLLARQVARVPDRTAVELNLGDWLSLGEASDLICRQANSDTATIRITESSVATWEIKARLDERTLNAQVSRKPESYDGVLASPSPTFTYVCAERRGPRDVLNASVVDTAEIGVGVHGEFAAHVLIARDRERVRSARLAEPNISGRSMLPQQVEAWMSRIVRPIQIKAEWFEGTSVTRLQFKTPGVQSEWTRPPNMGFGVSYALPLVVAALLAPVGGLLIVENPEAHLHPAAQSSMGAFLALVAADGVQVLLETHSDHVLNGIRKAVAGGDASLSPADVVIQFFHGEGESGPAVETLLLERTGQLSSWPAGFFDQAQRDLADLARAQRRRS